MQEDNASTTSLSSCCYSILQVHRLQQEKVMVSIHPSCKHNFIKFHLTQRLKFPTKNMCNTQVDGEHVQVFKDMKIIMDKYVLH